MHIALNSWALFLLSFCKSSPDTQCSPIYQSRPHPSAAERYNWHSSYQKSLQDSNSMELTLSYADFAIPPRILSGPEPLQIYTWQFGDEKKKN